MARKGGKDRGLFERPGGSGIWWIRYTDAVSNEHREKVGPKSLARMVYGKRKAEIREARFFPPERRRVILVREILDEYRQSALASGKSIIKGQPAYERLYNALGDKPAESLSPEELETFKLNLSKESYRKWRRQRRKCTASDVPASKTLSPASVNRHLVLLKAAFGKAFKAGKISRNPVRELKLFKENNIRVRYLNDEEEQRLLEALPLYLRPLIVVAIHTGMRRGELLSLRWEDVDFSARVITVRKSKSGYGRHIPMNDVVFKALGPLFLERSKEAGDGGGAPKGPEGFVFTSREGCYLQNLNRSWYSALQRARLKDFHFHDLRHTFASRLVMAAVGLYSVQTLLGHRTPEMVQRYAHLSPDHLRKAVEKLSPPLGSPISSGTTENVRGPGLGGPSPLLH